MDGHQHTALFEAPGGNPVLKVYPDPLTGGAPWTVGIGHTGPDVHQGDTWTEERCWTVFYADYSKAQVAAAQLVGAQCWAGLNEPRRAVLTDMAFQMGGTGLANFRHMLAAVKQGNWPEAKAELLDSDYALHDTPSRASKNAAALLSGKWMAEAMV